MEEFLTKLYSYEFFGTYLIIAIIVLIVLFIIILIYGKKDQKKRELEATKKLMQVNGEENNDQFVLEDSSLNEKEKLENDTIIVPNINELEENKTIENEIPEPILPVDNNVELPSVDDTPIAKDQEDTFKVEENEVPMEVNNFEPVLPAFEEKPFVFDSEENNNLPEENVAINSENEIAVPEFNFDEIAKNTEEIKEEEVKPKPKEVFSSVYAPLKEEKPEETKEEEIELPTLKKEYTEDSKIEEELPKLNDYNLDDISGESYDIK